MIPINIRPNARQLRQFAGIWFPLFALMVGLLLGQKFDLWRFAFGLWGFALLMAPVGLWRPQSARWLFVGLMILTFPIGFVISHLVLLVLYYLVLTPVGLALRLFGRDPLDKHPNPDATTYWVPHSEPDDIERYFRQY